MRHASRSALLAAIAAAVALAANVAAASSRLTPILRITREDVLEGAYTGVGLAASMAGKATGIITVGDASLAMLEGVDAAVDAGDTLTRQRLLVITAKKEVLEQLRKNGRLRAGDPAYDAVRGELQRESALIFPSSGAFLWRAMMSREGLTAFGRVSLSYGLRCYLGDRIVDRFLPGTRARSWIQTVASRDRAMPRATWGHVDRIARAFAKITDEMTRIAVDAAAVKITDNVTRTVDAASKTTATETRGDDSGPCGRMIVPGISEMVQGPFGPEFRQTADTTFVIPCPVEVAKAIPIARVERAVAVQRIEIARANPRDVAEPMPLPRAVAGTDASRPPSSRGNPTLGRAYNDALARRFGNWRE
jgi:hypothetical protein